MKKIIMIIICLISMVSYSEDNLIYTNYHIVVEGETLEDISKKYSVSLEDITSLNNLQEEIFVGQTLYIDLGEYKERWIDIDLSGGRNISSGKRIIKGRGSLITANKKVIDDIPNFIWPIVWKGATSEWGYRKDPITGAKKVKHSGIDLRAGIGTPVYSPESGIVRSAGWMKGYGRIVIIDHENGYSTRFAHLNEYLVEIDQVVEKGNLIAKTGNTGRSTGPHLHYEVRKDEIPLNPLEFKF